MKPSTMPDLIDAVIEDERWIALDLERLAEGAARAAFAQLGLHPEGFEISLLGCNDAKIQQLNSDFREKPSATNVLSWPSAERYVAGQTPELPDPQELGDIAISYDTCAKEAAEGGKSLPDHVQHLVLHGVLHLFGYDHETDADALLMERLEITILEHLGIADPYMTLNG